MKTAISIPDDLFRQADEFARRAGKSRSQLYREALSEYLRRREPEVVTSALDAVADSVEGTDFWVAATTRHIIERTEW